ncbi:hypothetical protein Tco_0979204 [Tanacetum coccineum]
MDILQIKFAAFVDARCVKQSNSDAMSAVTNGVDQTLRVDGKKIASSLISSSNNKPNLFKDPSPEKDVLEGCLVAENAQRLILKHKFISWSNKHKVISGEELIFGHWAKATHSYARNQFVNRDCEKVLLYSSATKEMCGLT